MWRDVDWQLKCLYVKAKLFLFDILLGALFPSAHLCFFCNFSLFCPKKHKEASLNIKVFNETKNNSRHCVRHTNYWDLKKKGTHMFLLWIAIFQLSKHVKGQFYCRRLTPEVCCSQQPLTFWYSLQHPQGQRNETRAPASSCPINCCKTSGTPGQLASSTWVSITRFDRSTAPLAALLHCPFGQSTLQLGLHRWVMPAFSVACQKEPGATEEVQISSNGLDPDGCAHDNRPPCLCFRVFVSEKRRGCHNNTAKLCMQNKYHWHVKEHCQLLW